MGKKTNMTKSPFNRNNWQAVEKHKKRNISNERKTEPFSKDATFLTVFVDEEDTSRTPLKSLLTDIESGFYPKPELLMWLAECFKTYYEAKGRVSLEHIFFGKEKSGVGNESARTASTDYYQKFSSHVFLQSTSINGIKQTQQSQIRMAEEFLTGFNVFDTGEIEIDAETFLRGWQRWKKTV